MVDTISSPLVSPFVIWVWPPETLFHAARAGTLARVSNPAASVLSDATILEFVRSGKIRIDPWEERLVQPASIDLRLGDCLSELTKLPDAFCDALITDPPYGLTDLAFDKVILRPLLHC